jgi:RES domain-containing protein
MLVYRVTRTEYANSLSGEGSRANGGRWNTQGLAAVYGAENQSLAMLENLVYQPFNLLIDYSIATIFVPDDAPVLQLDAASLPVGWDAHSHKPITVELGSNLLREAQYLMVRLPSAILPEEYNVMLNPNHAAMQHVRIEKIRPLIFDARFNNKQK